ncbi:MAG: hypothetical protein ACI9MC_002581, partial [Kiritimatiellia bacterium]
LYNVDPEAIDDHDLPGHGVPILPYVRLAQSQARNRPTGTHPQQSVYRESGRRSPSFGHFAELLGHVLPKGASVLN